MLTYKPWTIQVRVYTRGPYATMYAHRPQTIRQVNLYTTGHNANVDSQTMDNTSKGLYLRSLCYYVYS